MRGANMASPLSVMRSHCLFILTICSNLANGWTVKNYPNLADPTCTSNGFGQICDPDRIIDSQRDLRLFEARLDQIRTESPCECLRSSACRNSTEGYAIAVAILRDLEPLTSRQKVDDHAVAKFADSIRVRWNLGRCENDVLIAYCFGCRKIHLSHGSDIEFRVSDTARREMQFESNRLLTQSEHGDNHNYSVVFDFLLHKYYQFFVDLNATDGGRRRVGDSILNSHPLVHSSPDGGGITFGVKAVIILVAVLSVLWIGCVVYLLIITFKRHRSGSSSGAQRIRKGICARRSNGSLKVSSTWLWTPAAAQSPPNILKIAPAELDVIKKRTTRDYPTTMDSPRPAADQVVHRPKKFVTFESPQDDDSPSSELKLFDLMEPRSAGINKARKIRRSARETAELERQLGRSTTATAGCGRKGMWEPFADGVNRPPPLGRIAEMIDEGSPSAKENVITKL